MEMIFIIGTSLQAHLLISVADNSPEFLSISGKLQLFIWYADSLYEQFEYRKAEASCDTYKNESWCIVLTNFIFV